MKKLALFTIVFLLPSLLFAHNKTPVGDTQDNGTIIPSQLTKQAQQRKQFISQFFTWLNVVAKDPKKITKQDLLRYFNNQTIYSINGKTLAYDAAHLLARFHKMTETYKSMLVVLPAKIIIVANNNIAVHYQIKIENWQQQHYLDDVTVLITLKKDKIVEWRAVIAHHPA